MSDVITIAPEELDGDLAEELTDTESPSPAPGAFDVPEEADEHVSEDAEDPVVVRAPVGFAVESFIPESVDQLLAHSRRYPLLAPAQEIELAKRIERGDLHAKELLVNSNLRLVASNARRYQNQGLPLADLVQEGMLGLIRASEKFDWRKGFRFSTYATLWIRQAIQRGLEN